MFKPNNTLYRIYCAGPLFNPSERAEMEMLAEALELGGFKTFLPHRDGFLYGTLLPQIIEVGYEADFARWMVRQAIFALDVYQVLAACDGVVVNINGRVPDEGAVAEAAIAWTAGKAVVLFKDDARSLIDGLDNPLIAGLANFRLVQHSDELPHALERAIRESQAAAMRPASFPVPLQSVLARGQRLTEASATGDGEQVVGVVIELFDEFRDIARIRKKAPR
jgi:nucleoside 2-deoxyribosyltransferase